MPILAMTVYETLDIAQQYTPEQFQYLVAIVTGIAVLVVMLDKIISRAISSSKWATKRLIKSFLNTSDDELKPFAQAISDLPRTIQSFNEATKKMNVLCDTFDDFKNDTNLTFLGLIENNLTKCYVEMIKGKAVDERLYDSFLEQHDLYVQRGGKKSKMISMKEDLVARRRKEAKGLAVSGD